MNDDTQLLRAAIAALESQRPTLGDTVLETATAPLKAGRPNRPASCSVSAIAQAAAAVSPRRQGVNLRGRRGGAGLYDAPLCFSPLPAAVR